MRLVGTLLVILGVILLIYGGLTLFIPREQVDLGQAFSITVREDIVIPLPPIFGLLCLVVGIVMIMSAPVAMPPPPPY